MMSSEAPRIEVGVAGYLLLVATLIFGIWGFSHELEFIDIQYSDVTFHLSVLKALDSAFKAGRNPFDFWYDTVPYGFALFRSYQYLPYLFMYGFYRLAGEYLSLSTVLIGSTCLLASVALPVSVFLSLRMLKVSTLECGIAAILSVLVADGSEYGMGLQNYTFGTVGLITQLWAMVFLLPAIVSSYLYIREGRKLGLALLFSFLTFGSHVVAAVIIAVCVAGFSILGIIEDRRVGRRPFIFLALFLLVTAHQWWFVLADSQYINRSLLEPAWKYEGRGISYLLNLFWSGDLFDCDRFPVITLSLLVAFVYHGVYWKRVRSEAGGAFFAYAPAFLLLFFSLCAGRQLWGWLLNILPVLQSLHIHRFSIGIHLFGVLIVANGLAALARLIAPSRVREILFAILVLALLYPAFKERGKMFIETNRRQRATAALIAEDKDLHAVLKAVKELPYGWTYIGSNNTWQGRLLVAGYMPLDLMSASAGIPTVGGILFHAFSIAGETLFDFNPSNLSHFDLFGIRHVVAPSDWGGAPGFSLNARFGRYSVWTRDSRMLFLGDEQFKSGSDFKVHTDVVRLFVQQFTGVKDPPGKFELQIMENPWSFSGTVLMTRAGSIIAAEGFHPGWRVSVDGRPVQTRRVIPGFIAADLPEGRHQIQFEYRGSLLKPILLALSLVTILSLAIVRRRS